MKFVRLSHDRVTYDIDRDVWLQHCWSSSGAEVDCLRVAICSTLVRCYWCISILIIIPVVRWRSLREMKSYIASLTLHVYQWGSRSINLTLLQIRICSVSLACSETAEVWVRANRMSPSCSFYPFSHWSLSFINIHFATFEWDLLNDTVLFWWFQGVFSSY